MEHAGGILQKLLEGVSARIRPVFRDQDFFVDSVFAFAPEMKVTRFEKLSNLVQDTYFDFTRRLTEISSHITCNCAACRDVTALDLKFMIHYGEYVLSSVQNKPVLYGLDPTFVRNRGWKDVVSVSVGWRGYVLFTEPCLTNLNVTADKYQGERFFQDPISMFGSELKDNDT